MFEVFPSPSEEAVITAGGEDCASMRKWFLGFFQVFLVISINYGLSGYTTVLQN